MAPLRTGQGTQHRGLNQGGFGPEGRGGGASQEHAHGPSPSAFGSQVRAPCSTTVLSLGGGHLAALVLCTLPVLNQEPLVMGGHGVWAHHKVALAPCQLLLLSWSGCLLPAQRSHSTKTPLIKFESC